VQSTSPPIRVARLDELALLVEIERAVGEMFRSVGLDVVADDDPGSVEDLTPYADGGRAFVAVDDGDEPAGYLLLEVVDGAAHIEQVSVHPDAGRRGFGTALMREAEAWARRNGFEAITLTTYVDVPWNGPYYERLGFRTLSPEEETPGLRAIREHERAHGLDAWPRACMAKPIRRSTHEVSREEASEDGRFP
jgi:GNAT superfamily N-acetyltransferase